jgi:hypothetical protein
LGSDSRLPIVGIVLLGNSEWRWLVAVSLNVSISAILGIELTTCKTSGRWICLHFFHTPNSSYHGDKVQIFIIRRTQSSIILQELLSRNLRILIEVVVSIMMNFINFEEIGNSFVFSLFTVANIGMLLSVKLLS